MQKSNIQPAMDLDNPVATLIELRLRPIMLDIVPEKIAVQCLNAKSTSIAEILFSVIVDLGPQCECENEKAKVNHLLLL